MDTGWKIVAKSVIGDSHTRKGIPNQDAIGYYQFPGNHPACVLAVSDGHGSDRCARSDVGSTLAVNASIKVFIEFWEAFQNRIDESHGFENNPTRASSIENYVRKEITGKLVHEWKTSVERHMENVPLESAVEQSQKFLVYGATLTVIFASTHLSICIRLGDGEILIVEEDDRIRLMPAEEHSHIGEDTDSLCMPDAGKRFQVLIRHSSNIATPCPKLILACTDGFSNAFKSQESLEQSALDFCGLLATDKGRVEVEESLPGWLRDYSAHSGDDVSVGLVFNSIWQESPAIDSTQSEDVTLTGGVSEKLELAEGEHFVNNSPDSVSGKEERDNDQNQNQQTNDEVIFPKEDGSRDTKSTSNQKSAPSAEDPKAKNKRTWPWYRFEVPNSGKEKQ